MIALLAASLLLRPPAQPADELQAWTEDVQHFVAELGRLHPDPFHGISAEEFSAEADAFLAAIGSDEEQNLAGFMRLVASLSRQGREGHMLVWSLDFDLLPLRLYRFEDGWFVVAAEAPREGLVGQRVLAISGSPVEDAAQRLASLLCRDNEQDLRAKLDGALATVSLLRGARIQSGPGAVKLRLESEGTRYRPPRTRVVEIKPFHGHLPGERLPPRGDLVSARGRERAWWSEVLSDERALYVQYNEVRGVDATGETLAAFAGRLVSLVTSAELERVVVDVRWNGGGDNTTFGPLIDALSDPHIDRPGRLFALIGRHTFSAGGNFVTTLERETGALLVGEPTGGAPNQYGDAQEVRLPNHPTLLVRIPTRYHVFGSPDDPRTTHEPDLPVALRSSDYFAGRDPVLEQALRHR